MCGAETAYDFETHIDMRIGYIEGAGQLCTKCYFGEDNVKQSSSVQPKVTVLVDRDTILNTPNDMELGAKVRQLYYENNS